VFENNKSQPQKNDFEFWSKDNKLGLRVSIPEVQKILELCTGSGANETGGIIVGFYNEEHNCAMATSISSAPIDSKSNRTSFFRGIRGIQTWLNHLWRVNQHFYLGEWHFHPNGAAFPSNTDINQMKNIADSDSYHCPEPILLIIGGDPTRNWAIKAYVFFQDVPFIELGLSNKE